MSEETSTPEGGSLPPKLDLRKTGVLKGHVWPAPGAGEKEAPSGEKAAASGSGQSVTPPAVPSASSDDAATGKGTAPKTVDPAAKRKPLAAKPVTEKASANVPVAKLVTSPRPAQSATPPVAKPVGGTPKPATARIKVPSEAEQEAAAPEAKPASKHETSKIPLEMASPSGGKMGTSTIKIKPAVKPATVKTIMPGGRAPKAAAGEPASPASATTKDSKRQTSRIPLESALSADTGTQENAGAPKTIRLKRPGGASTLKAAAPGAGAKPGAGKKPAAAVEPPQPAAVPAKAADGAAADRDKDSLGKTSRLDEAAAEPDTATPTRKKTIRVKRPTQATGAKKELSVARPEGQAQPGPASRGLQPPTPFEEPPEPIGWFFGFCGIAATLVAAAVVYMLLAQVLGSDPSLTKLSYYAPGVDLPWTGEVRVD